MGSNRLRSSLLHALRSNASELAVAAGLFALVYGLWPWLGRGSLVPMALILLWVGLPQRVAFVERPKPAARITRKQQLNLNVREGRDE